MSCTTLLRLALLSFFCNPGHHWNCGGEVVVLGTRLLTGSAHGSFLLYHREGEEQKEVLEAKDDDEKESEADGEVEERESQSTCA